MMYSDYIFHLQQKDQQPAIASIFDVMVENWETYKKQKVFSILETNICPKVFDRIEKKIETGVWPKG